eukprot:1159235-Pelagomonas_calceolata.AAC.23
MELSRFLKRDRCPPLSAPHQHQLCIAHWLSLRLPCDQHVLVQVPLPSYLCNQLPEPKATKPVAPLTQGKQQGQQPGHGSSPQLCNNEQQCLPQGHGSSTPLKAGGSTGQCAGSDAKHLAGGAGAAAQGGAATRGGGSGKHHGEQQQRGGAHHDAAPYQMGGHAASTFDEEAVLCMGNEEADTRDLGGKRAPQRLPSGGGGQHHCHASGQVYQAIHTSTAAAGAAAAAVAPVLAFTMVSKVPSPLPTPVIDCELEWGAPSPEILSAAALQEAQEPSHGLASSTLPPAAASMDTAASAHGKAAAGAALRDLGPGAQGTQDLLQLCKQSAPQKPQLKRLRRMIAGVPSLELKPSQGAGAGFDPCQAAWLLSQQICAIVGPGAGTSGASAQILGLGAMVTTTFQGMEEEDLEDEIQDDDRLEHRKWGNGQQQQQQHQRRPMVPILKPRAAGLLCQKKINEKKRTD